MKGLIFYLDAIMALILALVIISGIGIYYSIEPELKYKTVHAEAEDVMQLLSQKVNATELGISENYTDKSFLEVIGTLWLNGNHTEATQVAADVLDEFDRRCVELSFEGEVIYNRTGCDEAWKNVAVANRVASGYTPGKKPDGYMTRVILNREKKITSDYTYFGGYIGDGNVTKNMALRFIDKALEAKMEIDAGSNFTLYINGNYSGTYVPSETNMSSNTFIICNETNPNYCDYFQENNTIKFLFTGNRSYIGGGYLVVKYNITEFQEDLPPDKYEFPGIEGVINIYSSFYIPGTLQQISAFLHYTSNYTIFLNIGNVTVYTGSSPEDVDINITINNSEMNNSLSSGGVSYSDLSNKTIPLRLGVQNVSYITIGYDAADVFSVTDLSGSMSGSKMTNAKQANYALVDIILNYTPNRVGLVGYEDLARDSDFHHLTNESQPLKNLVNYTWDADGRTCICCGINKAVENFFSLPVTGENKLVAYFQFENNLTDMSGNGNDGTAYGNPTYVGGINGSAVDLDGNDYIGVSDTPELSGGTGKNLTVAAWIRANSLGGTPTNPVPVVMKYRNSWNKDWGLGIANNKVYFGAERSGNGWDDTGLVGDTDLNVLQWHHVAFTLEGRDVKIYLDGKLNGSVTLGFDTPDTSDNVEIGRDDDKGDYFDGRIDEVRIYEEVFNITEIQGLAEQNPSCGNNLTEIGEVCDGDFKLCESGGNNGMQSCNDQCAFDACNTTGECGDGIWNAGEECDDGNTNNSDSCSATCEREKEWYRSMIMMSDGEANVECTPYNICSWWDNACKQRAKDDAVQAACDAYNNYGIEVYAVGFGSDVDETTLRNIADCGHGEYYYSNVTELEEIYKLIAAQILNASYKAQTVEVHEGDYGNITLYPDSFINFTYIPSMEQPEYGEISIKVEGSKFGGSVESPKNGTFVVPNGTRILDAKITSYSSEYWTDRALIDNGTDWEYIYRLWDYIIEYKNLGDPYVVYIPIEKISEGLNNVSIDTGGTEENTTGGSPDSRIIYTLAVNILSDYGGIFNKTEGCKKELYYDLDLDGTQDGSMNIIVGNESDPYDPSVDAIDNALMKLLDKLNFYDDTGTDDGSSGNPIDVYPGELSFDTIPIGGIPWLWGPGIFTLKVW